MEYKEFYKDLMEDTNYHGEHKAPDKEGGKPIYDLTEIYPDIYTEKFDTVVRYYGTVNDGVDDRESLKIILSVKNKPNANVKIYRAIPNFNKEIVDKVKEINNIIYYHSKHRFFPMRNNLINSLRQKFNDIEDYNEKEQVILKHLESLSEEYKKQIKKIVINDGDWVTINKNYAKLHGESALNNKYTLISMTAKANNLYTDGNSIHEFGYSKSSINENLTNSPI